MSEDGKWKASGGDGPPLTMNFVYEKPNHEVPKSLKGQLVWYKDRVAELQARNQMQGSEYRVNQEELQQLRSRCARYERLLDHLLGRV